ncbi:c-type cytochrome [Duganella sp. FT92W]|uniref:cytochrome-c oxidase n=2 Tax=Pseudoduganella rivuli TaxID=2666085 RepID=A0A7X2LTD4_9BURK|nr:c-type cytochrome [Pseudoduganella rivuli]
MALALILIVIGTVAFHFASPWWLTPLASNWQQMDDALMLTLYITAAIFIIINLFVAYAVIKFRHRDGLRASRESHNKKLEWWLIGVTSLGIAVMLAPGLDVYAKLINAPTDAMQFEVMGQQWQWHYRLPGRDGKLGKTDVSHISPDNPFGLSDQDPNGQDDVLVESQEIHIPVGRAVKVMLRSQDVLHDFYVPQFRTRMNMVPGMVTSFWFTPTRTGKFEVLCAQLCGVGHANMRSWVIVDEPPAYAAWLAGQPTFAAKKAGVSAAAGAAGAGAGAVGAGGDAGATAGADIATQGKLLAQARGCVACHSADGAPGVGPTWKGLYGKNEALDNGSSVVADDAYLKQAIADPKASIVKGYPPVMPQQPLSETELAALVGYIKTLK